MAGGWGITVGSGAEPGPERGVRGSPGGGGVAPGSAAAAVPCAAAAGGLQLSLSQELRPYDGTPCFEREKYTGNGGFMDGPSSLGLPGGLRKCLS